jgi:hypothetical protein
MQVTHDQLRQVFFNTLSSANGRGFFNFFTHFHSRINFLNSPPTPSITSTCVVLIRIRPHPFE